VDFIIVGGVAAVLQGAPLDTLDLDIVHSREPANIQRLLASLEALDASYRISGQRGLKPRSSHLSSARHQLLLTRYSPLDLLGVIGNNRGYSDLLPHTQKVRIGAGAEVAVLDLATLIQVKEETAGEKDRAVLPLLRRTLKEKSQR